MALTNSQYNTIMKSYEEKQLTGRRALDERQAVINREIPEHQELSARISSLSIECAARLLDGDESALAELKETIARLHDTKRLLLLSKGFSSDYLELKYTCPDCKDTGYIGTEKCHCFKHSSPC